MKKTDEHSQEFTMYIPYDFNTPLKEIAIGSVGNQLGGWKYIATADDVSGCIIINA